MSDTTTQPTTDGNALQHDWNADGYYRRPHLRLRILAELLEARAPRQARVLDVGCGPGILAELLALGEGYVGLDQFNEGFRPELGLDLRDWTWNDEAPAPLVEGEVFDLIVASGLLEYISKRGAFFERVREALAPGGRFFTSMVLPTYWPRRRAEARGLSSAHPCWKDLPSPVALEKEARAAGMMPVASTPVINVWQEWPHASWSLLRTQPLGSLAELSPGPFVDQYVHEFRSRDE